MWHLSQFVVIKKWHTFWIWIELLWPSNTNFYFLHFKLGIGKSPNAIVTKPTMVHSNLTFVSLPKIKNRYSLAITTGGELVGFGDNRDYCVGTGTREAFIYEPRVVRGLRNEFVIDAAGGTNHVLAVTKSNKLYSFGSNSYGQLGFNESVPLIIQPHALNFDWQGGITRVATGDAFSIVVVEDQYIYVFGDNSQVLL